MDTLTVFWFASTGVLVAALVLCSVLLVRAQRADARRRRTTHNPVPVTYYQRSPR